MSSPITGEAGNDLGAGSRIAGGSDVPLERTQPGTSVPNGTLALLAPLIVEQGSLAQLAQLVVSRRLTTEARLELADGAIGVLWFERGELVSAAYGALSPAAAARLLLAAPHARVSAWEGLEPPTRPLNPREFTADLQRLCLDGRHPPIADEPQPKSRAELAQVASETLRYLESESAGVAPSPARAMTVHDPAAEAEPSSVRSPWTTPVPNAEGAGHGLLEPGFGAPPPTALAAGKLSFLRASVLGAVAIVGTLAALAPAVRSLAGPPKLPPLLVDSHEGSAAAPAAPLALEPNPAAIEVDIKVTPVFAIITLDGSQVAIGEMSLQLPPNQGPHQLQVRAPGYLPKDFWFSDAPPPRQVQLELAPAPPELLPEDAESADWNLPP